MKRTWLRRPVTGFALIATAILLTTLAPLWLLAGTVTDVACRRWRLPIVRLLAFGVCWAWLEVLGIIAATWLWGSGRSKQTESYYRIQEWWCRSVVRSLAVCVGLKFEVDGAEHVSDGPFIALARHVSLADAVMSSWLVGTVMGKNPRYVLKSELKLDPCLDIFGHRLPNYFIERDSSDVALELQGIEQMANGLMHSDVAVIFPEGSRANDKKRLARLEALKTRSPLRYERLRNLQYLLPPKPAGAAALLRSVPTAKVITIAHSGLEGMDNFGSIIRNLGRNIVQVKVSVAQIDRSAIPSGDAFVAWLDDQWVKMDNVVRQQIASSSTRIQSK